jgi:hypothetical protein
MTSCKHVIAGKVNGGFVSTLFSPYNSLPITTRPFGDTMVSIAVALKFLKLDHFLVPQFNMTIDIAILGEVS